MVKLQCECGRVSGEIVNVRPKLDRHLVCCCDDCQAFAHFLKKADVLDEWGGTQIVQMTPAQVQLHEGVEHIKCVRLTARGVYRWYTDCCHTPVANTMSSGVPFIGVIHSIFASDDVIDEVFGKPLMRIQTKYAMSEPPLDPKTFPGFPLKFLPSMVWRLMLARLQGEHKPTPFFDCKGKPIAVPSILSNVNVNPL